MLTGLARDGGLYVPESWPQLAPETIAGFFGRPYWEVAVEVIRPFVGDEIPDADLGRMANEAYATFRHPAVVPLTQIDPHQFVLELFHGPTLAFKDVAMQLISRMMDHVLAQRAQRTTIVVATSGDTGGAAVDAFAGLDNVDLIVLFPHGRISDVQRRMMTTTGAGNVHALAVEGTFDDCQAIVKGLFNHHGFRDAVALSGVNSINWARIVAQVVYYFTSAVALGAPLRKVDFTVPTGNFGWACRCGGCGSPPMSTTSCRARSKPASMKYARFTPQPRRRWISRSHRISNVCCSRRAGGMPRSFAA
jgi:threonine synthase